MPSDTPPPQTNDPLHGTPYRAISALGGGGMGEVYEVEHRLLGRRFVVKLLRASLQNHPALVDRMRVEGQALGALRHPNLVEVTDFGHTAQGRPYLVMERLKGLTLGQLVATHGALPWRHALRIAEQLLSGLSAAHAVGIVHRDIKLENILLHEPAQGKQVVKVLDFGIAKIMEGASGLAPTPLLFPTAEGVVVGTPRFVAPEQAANRPLDQRADVYAAGLVLYTLLAGRGPFDDLTTEAELIEAHITLTPRPLADLTNNVIPAGLEGVIRRALEKNPDQRFGTAAAFRAALAAFTGGSPSGALDTTEFDRVELSLRSSRGSAPEANTRRAPASPPMAVPVRDGHTYDVGAQPTRTTVLAAEPDEPRVLPEREPNTAAHALPKARFQAGPDADEKRPPRSKPRKTPVFALSWIGLSALLAMGAAAYYFFWH